MDEIADCIADHQYNEALRMNAAASPEDALASSIHQIMPKPPKKPAAAAENAERCMADIASSASAEALVAWPIGRFFLAEAGLKQEAYSENEMKDMLAMLSIMQDARLTSKSSRADILGAMRRLLKLDCSVLEKDKPKLAEVVERLEASTAAGELAGLAEDTLQIVGVLERKLKDDLVKFYEALKGDEELFQRYMETQWYSLKPVKIDDFIVFRELGRGAFGVVAGSRHKVTGQMVALKGMNRKLVKGKRVTKLIKHEKKVLQMLGEEPSPFCVYLKYSFKDKTNMYFGLPLMTGGDLHYHLCRSPKAFGLERTVFYAAEIFLGLSHLHSLGIIYRDLKPENILLDETGHTMISDLGLAVTTEFTPETRDHRTIQGKAGTPGYWSYEIVNGKGYAFDADWWSYGCCIFEFLNGRCPFAESVTQLGDRNKGTLQWDIPYDDIFGEPFPADAKDLISKLLLRDRKNRMGVQADTVANIRDHPFFSSINWVELSAKETTPPWKPSMNSINAISQSDIQLRNKERQYRKIKLSAEDDIDLTFIAKVSHEEDIVKVLNLDKAGKLEKLKKQQSEVCTIL